MHINVEVTDEQIADMLCSALEGGSNYRYQIVAQQAPVIYRYQTSKERVYSHIDYPINPGGSLTISSIKGDELRGAKQWKLTRIELREGLRVMAAKAPRHFADMLLGNGDAITGDVFLQCCLFGEVVYG